MVGRRSFVDGFVALALFGLSSPAWSEDVVPSGYQLVAAEKKIPLADFHAECLHLRPRKSWDGTLISKDGVHPSGGKNNVYSEDNLKECGYALRNWVNFLVYRQLYFQVLEINQ